MTRARKMRISASASLDAVTQERFAISCSEAYRRLVQEVERIAKAEPGWTLLPETVRLDSIEERIDASTFGGARGIEIEHVSLVITAEIVRIIPDPAVSETDKP